MVLHDIFVSSIACWCVIFLLRLRCATCCCCNGASVTVDAAVLVLVGQPHTLLWGSWSRCHGPANCGVPQWWLCLMAAASWWLIGMASQLGSKRAPSCKASDTLCPRVPLVLAPRAAAQATTWWAIGHIATWIQAACARCAARGLTMTIVLFARKVAKSSCVMVGGAPPWHTTSVLACRRCQWVNGGALPAAQPPTLCLGRATASPMWCPYLMALPLAAKLCCSLASRSWAGTMHLRFHKKQPP